MMDTEEIKEKSNDKSWAVPDFSKKIFSASLQLTTSRALVRLLSLVTMPILTHLLMPSAYGIVAIGGTLISLLSVFALTGMDMSYMRSFNDNSGASFKQVEIFAWHYVFVAGTIAALLLLIAWPIITSHISLPSYLGPLLGAGIIINLTNTMAQTRARLNSQYRPLSIAIIASGIGAAIISVSLAYWWRQDELPLLLSMLASYLIPVLLLGVPTLSHMKKGSGLSPSERKTVIKIGLAGIITAPAYWLITSSDRWMLGYFENADSVGIYSVGYSVAILGMMINNAIHAVWTPETVNEFNNNPDAAPLRLGQAAEGITYAFACVCLAVMAAGGDIIRLLATPAFHDAASVVPFIAVSVFFHGLTHLANASLLLLKKLYYSMWCWIIGGVLCLVLNFLLIPTMGRTGAALTQTISMAAIAVTISWFAQKLYPLHIRWSKLLSTLFVLFLCGIGMSYPWDASPLLSLAFKLPAGMVIVFGVVLFHAPNLPTILRGKFISSSKESA